MTVDISRMSQPTPLKQIVAMIDTLSPDEQEELINIVLLRKIELKNHKNATLSEEEKEIARKRFESHFGEIDCHDSTSIDNESVDNLHLRNASKILELAGIIENAPPDASTIVS